MLKRQYRLPARTRLQHPFFYRTQLFRVKIAQNNLAYSRFGFIVRKAVDKRAARRNQIRRLFRSCIEDMARSIQTGYDMLFFLEKGIIDKDKESLCRQVQDFLVEKKLIGAKDT